MKNLIYFFFVLLTIGVITCNKAEVSGSKSDSMSPNLPKNTFEYNSNNFNSFNPIDNHLATLGRVLFYDKKLSQNSMTSCGSCHKQNLGFGDNVAHSIGFSGLKTPRNSIAIINLNKFNSLFWDARRNQLDSMVLDPIMNHVEMGINNINIVTSKINQYSYYNDLFNKAFGSTEITKERMALALAEFVRSIRSSDKFISNLSNIHNTEGAILFQKYQCNNCHQVGNIINTSWGGDMANTGLDQEDSDEGAGKTFNIPSLNGSFKIPSLINVGLSAPYMHDGRFNTLEEVVEHYSNGIKPNKNLDFRLRKGFEDLIFTNINFFNQQKNVSENFNVKPRQSNITERDKKILIQFLKGLTDEDLVRDPRYANPFLN